MVGRGRPPRNARRTADRGSDVEQRDPRDIEIERLQQRIRDLEIQHEIHNDETLSNPKYHNFSQRASSFVEDFIAEFDRLRMRCDVDEEEEQVIARFLGALQPHIADVVHLQQYLTYEDDIDELVYADQGEALVTQRVLNVAMAETGDDTSWLWNNIFRTKCTTKGKVCTVIIDGGSCDNMVATTLKYINGQHKLSPRHAKWVEFLQAYSFTIRHKAGSANVVADALSRRHVLTSSLQIQVSGFDTFRTLYQDDPDFRTIWSSCATTPFRDFSTQQGYLFKGRRVCIPMCSLRDSIILESHAGGLAGHFGRDKTLALLRGRFYWPKIERDISRIIARCRVCHVAKTQHTNAGLYTPLPVPAAPWEDVKFNEDLLKQVKELQDGFQNQAYRRIAERGNGHMSEDDVTLHPDALIEWLA
nr:RNA-directed DNA polymerase [Tanacetum cinerariifolium]